MKKVVFLIFGSLLMRLPAIAENPISIGAELMAESSPSSENSFSVVATSSGKYLVRPASYQVRETDWSSIEVNLTTGKEEICRYAAEDKNTANDRMRRSETRQISQEYWALSIPALIGYGVLSAASFFTDKVGCSEDDLKNISLLTDASQANAKIHISADNFLFLQKVLYFAERYKPVEKPEGQ